MFTPGPDVPIPPMVSVFTYRLGWVTEATAANAPGSASFEAADRAVYVPIFLPSPCVLRRVWWANGDNTTGGATIECGLYRDSGYGPGAKVISGSATQGTALQVQFVDVTDTSLSVGLYWIAIMASTPVNCTLLRSTFPTTSFAGFMRFEESSANPLPAAATPVQGTVSSAYLCGFATTASP